MSIPQDQLNTQPRHDDAYQFRNSEEDIQAFIKKNPNDNDFLLDADELQVQADLGIRKASKLKELDQYLHGQNMLINYKKMVCMRSCYSDLEKPTKEIMPCVQGCQRSEKRFNTFVSKLFGRIESLRQQFADLSKLYARCSECQVHSGNQVL